MNLVWPIAKNTYREIIRDRILYGLVIFAILLILISLALGQLTFAEQTRITLNFGLMGIHFSAIVLSIFVGSTLVSKEIDKKTVLTLLVRPLSRSQFLMGKFLGLVFVIVSIILGLAMIMAIIFFMRGIQLNPLFLVSLWGILLEALILLGMSLFFSSFTRPMLVVAFSFGVFLIGHWMDSLKFFSEKSESLSFQVISVVVQNGMPNLEKFNWRSLAVYNENLELSVVLNTSLYSFVWVLILFILTSLVLGRKDLG